MKMHAFASLAAILALCANSSIIQASETQSAAENPQYAQATTLETLNEGAVVNSIHHANNLEILEGKMALGRAHTPAVRQFAQKLVTDHAKNEGLLRKLVHKLGVPLYYFQKATYEAAGDDQVMRLTGNDFEQDFLLLQIQGHRRAIANLEMLNEMVENADVKNFIAATLPAVRMHLDEATALLNGTPTR